MTDLCPRTASIRTDSLPQHLDASLARANHPQQSANRGGFARAVQTQEPIDFSLIHSQVDMSQRLYVAVILGKIICFDCILHFGSFDLSKIDPRLFLY